MKDLYRGKIKGKSTGHYELDWAFGNRVTELSTGRTFICDLSHFDDATLLKDVLIEVIPETVGQCIDLPDKNGFQIFESDIVSANRTVWIPFTNSKGEKMLKATSRTEDVFGKIIYSNKTAQFTSGNSSLWLGHYDDIAVVGNVFDNPDLIGKFHD